MRALMRVGVVAACALVAAGCGGDDGERRPAPPPPPPPPPTANLFDYDRSAPLAFADRGRVNASSPIVVRDVSYASEGGRVRAFLLTPPGRGPFPAVIYAHGSGQDRLAFVGVAAWIVARGAVAITVDQPSPAGPDPQPDPVTALRRQRDRTARSVVDLRRTVDLLESLPEVDEERLGFVGFSAGARLGAILSGVEKRIDGYVLMSGGASPVGEYLEPVAPEARAELGELLSAVDPLQHVSGAAPAELLFQLGRRDEIIPRKALEALAEAGSEPKEIRRYDAAHSLDVQAYRDHLDWLEQRLRIEGPPVRGASTGP